MNSPDVDGLMSFPFPMRDGITAWLTIPQDFTIAEAHSLCDYVIALASVLEVRSKLPT